MTACKKKPLERRLGHGWAIQAKTEAETVDLQRSQMCGKQDLKLMRKGTEEKLWISFLEC